jgi:hypothetical protein
MAVTDVAPLVTPTYTATLNVVNDGSVLTQAALTSLVVSLANRTEFLRDLIAEASDTPEAYCTLREEFLGSVWTSGQSLLQGNVQWRTTASGSVSVSGNAGASKNPGLLNVSVPGDGATNEKFIFYLESATGLPFSFLKFQEMTVVLKVIRDVANITDRVHFGLADDADDQAGGDDAILISHLGANAKWQLVRRVGGVQTTTTLTLADFADSEFAVWRSTSTATWFTQSTARTCRAAAATSRATKKSRPRIRSFTGYRGI